MLTLVLTLAMLLSVMVVGAGAAVFNDQDSIKNTEAVDACSALNIINGENGSFYPTRNVTRAEMCKMICVALNGGREPTLGNISANTFTDTQGHWAAPYIEYCVKNGVVAGVGGGRFDPDGAVTGTQAAKMLLVAMGFNPVYQHYVGSDAWELNINSDAFGKGLYTKLESIDTSAPLSRDNAAQLIYNAVDATMVWYDFVPQTVNGAVTMVPQLKDMTRFIGGTENECSIFTEKYDGRISEGVLTASGKYGVMGGTTNTDTLCMNVEKVNGAKVTLAKTPFTWKGHDLTDMVGLYSKILSDKNTGKVYGVFAIPEENTLDIKTTVNKVCVSDGKIKIDDTKYDYDAGAIVHVDGGAGQTVAASSDYIGANAKAVAKADNIRLISNDGDNEIDVILIDTIAVSEVAYVGGSDFSLSAASVAGSRPIANDGATNLATYAKSSQKLADVNVYDGIAKDDYVLITENYYTAKDAVTKLDVSSGTITGVRGDGITAEREWQIDGTWYKPVVNGDGTRYDGLNVLSNGDTLNYIAIDGIVYFAEKTTANSVKDIAAVITVGKNSGITTIDGNTLEAKLLFSDGSKKTVTVAKIDGVKVTSGDVDTLITATTGNAAKLIGDLVIFSVNNDGEYELKSIPANSDVKANIANYDRSLANSAATDKQYTANNKTIAGYTLADDAVVFVVKASAANKADSANDGKLFTGREIKRLVDNFGTNAKSSLTYTPGLVTSRNGIKEVAVAVLSDDNIPGITGAGTSYGYLVQDSYWEHNNTDGKDYNVYTYWNGSAVVTSREESTERHDYPNGQVIGFDTVSDGIIKNVKMVGIEGMVTGYNKDTGIVQLHGRGGVNYEITNDTTILYVDTSATEGRSGGSIELAYDTDKNGTPDVNNVLYIVNDGTKEVDLLVVDVDNNYETKSQAFAEVAPAKITNNNDLQALFADYNVVEVTDAFTLPAALTVPAGKTLVSDALLTATNTNSLTVNGTVIAKAGVTATGSTNAVIVNGIMTVSGTITAPENITVNATGKLNLQGSSACVVATVDGIALGAVGATVTVDTLVSGALSNVYTDAGTEATTDSDGNPVSSVAGQTASSGVAAGKTMVATTVVTDTSNTKAIKLLVK